jgi:hypothetical protein
MKTRTLTILRFAFLCVTGTALFSAGGLSSTHSRTVEHTQQRSETDQATPECDIDGSRKELEDCPSQEVIGQYRERYGLTVVLRGGTYWRVDSGQYVNPTYGYSIRLPDGVEALCSLPPAPQHGFLVDVGNELSRPSIADESSVGRSWLDLEVGLWVDGSYNATFYDSVDEAAEASLTYLKAEHPDDLIILEWEHTTFYQLPAIHACIQFRSSKSGETLTTDKTMALREYDNTGIIYTVNLTSRASRYREDQAVLKRIVEGWSETNFE